MSVLVFFAPVIGKISVAVPAANMPPLQIPVVRRQGTQEFFGLPLLEIGDAVEKFLPTIFVAAGFSMSVGFFSGLEFSTGGVHFYAWRALGNETFHLPDNFFQRLHCGRFFGQSDRLFGIIQRLAITYALGIFIFAAIILLIISSAGKMTAIEQELSRNSMTSATK